MKEDTPILQTVRLTKSYGGLQAVRGISFSVRKGAITGLIGPNGAGKTITFNMIAGSQTPTSGHVLLDGENITGVATDRLYHKRLMRTFQLSHEFAKMTSLENLMVAGADQPGENLFKAWFSRAVVAGRETQLRERARDALAFPGLTDAANELAGNLSAGQKKLLEFGRIMMHDARLVLLDEPGAGVNPALMLHIARMIRRLNEERNYTFCIIEHDMDLITDLCETTIVMADGRILAEGTMDEIRDNHRVIEAYFGGDGA